MLGTAAAGSPVDVDAVLLAGSVDAGSWAAMRGRVREVGQRLGLADLRLTKFVLVVHELVINAVCHGNGWAEVVVWTDSAGLRCAVTDDGPGIPRRHIDLGRGVSDNRIPGYGLRLVRQICPDMRVDTGSHGTRIEIGYPTGGVAVRAAAG